MTDENLKKLIGLCHYYKGEQENPYESIQNPDYDTLAKSTLWFYERYWVIMMCRETFPHDYSIEYSMAGLEMFSNMDGVPTSLRALLFNRYCKTAGGSKLDMVNGFKKFYNKWYH